jgi:cell pole-organizing protein PopZ
MAEKQDGEAAAEPSMEEILASIRKIIADEKDPAAPAAPAADGEDVIELTQMVQDDGSIVDLAAPTPPEPPVTLETPPLPPEPEPVPEPPPPPPPPPPVPEPPAVDLDALVSEGVASAATSAMTELAHKVQGERSLLMPSYTALGDGARTLEEMTLELLRPLLKDWLDRNLSALVERVVQREVERIARRVQD